MNPKRTELYIDKNPEKIHEDSRIMSIGSKFSNMMASEFKERNISIESNPFGNIYNPLSIFNTINVALKNEPVDEKLITEADDKWHHYDFHSKIGADSKEELIEKLNKKVQKTHDALNKTDFLILTFGSAYVYKTASKNQLVANCHKGPTNKFNKSLLSVADIIAGFRQLYPLLNHMQDIILVVSPILQLQDSLTLNTVSKSVLRLACHMIKNEFPYVKYFPAYEFMMSDLRDYNRYEKDMITPSAESMDYIFDKFSESYFQ